MRTTKTFSAPSLPAISMVWRQRIDLSLHLLLTLGALVLWLISLNWINFRDMNDLGLISIMPVGTIISLIMLTVSFCITLRQPEQRVPLLFAQIVVLIVMLYGITTFVEEAPRFAVTWLHVGFTEYIARTGSVAPNLEARFNWPGFFILNAFITQVGGFRSALEYVSWAPVLYNLLYMAPLFVIFSLATPDKRFVWLALWFYYLSNWIGQDYFSPQGLAYFLNLVFLATLLKWFSIRQPQTGTLGEKWQSFGPLSKLANWVHDKLGREQMAEVKSSPWQRAGIVTILLLMFLWLTGSHQLTPQLAILTVIMLVVLNRCKLRSLPILMIVLVATWLIFMTVPYLIGHSRAITGNIGRVGDTVTANVVDRIQGSVEHVFVVQMRLFMTGAIWILAFVGGLRRLKHGYWDITYALLAALPFALLFLQSYGGEALLRTYFFALPFMVFFAAALFYTSPSIGTSWRYTAVIAVLSVGLIVAFHITRYGNERMDYMTARDVEAVQFTYNIAPPGSQLVIATQSVPWRHQDYEKYTYKTERDAFLTGNTEELAYVLSDERYTQSYFILTRSQRAFAELFMGLKPEVWDENVRLIEESGLFEIVFQNEDATVYVAVPLEDMEMPNNGGTLQPEIPADGTVADPIAPIAPPAVTPGAGTDAGDGIGEPVLRPTAPAGTTTPSEGAVPSQDILPAEGGSSADTIGAESPTVVVPSIGNIFPGATEYVEYTVQEGDLLSILAQRYNTTEEAITALNQDIDPDNLVVGDVIRVPVNVVTQVQPRREYISHVIQNGDAIYDLARQYNTTPEAIIALNPDVNPQELVVGEVLRIPTGQVRTTN